MQKLRCNNCGKYYTYEGKGRKPSYCSDACRVKANRLKKRKPPEERVPVTVDIPQGATIKTMISKHEKELTEQTFKRMCDSSVEDELRFAQHILHEAMLSPNTPPQALAALGKELINMTKQLNDIREQAEQEQADPFTMELNESGEPTFDPTSV